MSTAQVQRWVVTVLVVAVVGHLSEALAVFALLVPEQQPSSRIGLQILAGIVGVLTVVAVRVIHERRVVSLWLLLGLTPAVVSSCVSSLR